MSSSLSHHSNNPFRDAVIPNSTGQSLSSSRTYAPPPGPPPGASNTSHLPTVPSVSISNESDARLPPGENFQSELDGMPSEPPPPYTPTPSRWEEETVQYGPRRPFQPAPPPLRPIPPQSTRPAASPNPGQSLQSGAYMAPSGPPHINTTSSPSSFRPPPGPPPRHPSTLLSPDGSTPPRRSASSASSHSHTPSMPGSFAPPPGPPPLARRRSDVGSQGNGSGVSASSSTPPPVPNDGKPTRKPVVGHPYMHNGEVLVYPPRFTCNKCMYNYALSRTLHLFDVSSLILTVIHDFVSRFEYWIQRIRCESPMPKGMCQSQAFEPTIPLFSDAR